jgi:crotonobetainyl-CoA:carnitine CoA-transferase CaiB-like acyl-CoA transferase
MPGSLEGVKVVELATMVAAPSCAGVLADWGAEVIKVETPAGDPMRHHFQPMSEDSPPFELDNRGKRGIVLDLKKPVSLDVMLRLLAEADVFVSNVHYDSLESLGLDYESLHERFPRLIYCHMCGYGLHSSERDRPAYDVGAYWSRTGFAHMYTTPGCHPPIHRGGAGDHPTGAIAAGGVCAALFARERSGEGQLVEASLVRAGAYCIAWDLLIKMQRPNMQDEPWHRSKSLVPITNVYQTRDNRWIWLLMFEIERHLEPFMRAIGLWEQYGDDPTFAPYDERDVGEGFTITQYALDRIERAIAIFDETLASKTLAEWREIFDEHGIWYEVVQNREEFLADPVARDTNTIVEDPDSGVRTIATPIELEHMDRANYFRPAPDLGGNTVEILDELGLSADERAEVLREIGREI